MHNVPIHLEYMCLAYTVTKGRSEKESYACQLWYKSSGLPEDI